MVNVHIVLMRGFPGSVYRSRRGAVQEIVDKISELVAGKAYEFGVSRHALTEPRRLEIISHIVYGEHEQAIASWNKVARLSQDTLVSVYAIVERELYEE